MNADRKELSKYRTALAAHPAAGAGACPRPERIWEAARGELRPREVAELADHTLVCADCSLAWQLAIEIGQSPEQAEPLRSPVSRRRQAWGGLLAVAATVLLAVTMPWQDYVDPPESGDRGEEVLGIDEISTVSRQNCVLSWPSAGPDAVYSIEVFDENLDEIARASSLQATEYRVAPESLAGLAPGAVLIWSVEATTPDGTEPVKQSESVLE